MKAPEYCCTPPPPGSKRLVNCPNCGAPLGPSGRCEYCGSIVNEPQKPPPPAPVIIKVNDVGIHRLDMASQILFDYDVPPAMQAQGMARMEEEMLRKLVKQLHDSGLIKRTVRQYEDPRMCAQNLSMRMELYVVDPSEVDEKRRSRVFI